MVVESFYFLSVGVSWYIFVFMIDGNLVLCFNRIIDYWSIDFLGGFSVFFDEFGIF